MDNWARTQQGFTVERLFMLC